MTHQSITLSYIFEIGFLINKMSQSDNLHAVNSTQKADELHKIFDSDDLRKIRTSDFRATEILSFFATSLFDQNNTESVLWSVVENCITKLNLEDAVIYLLDKKNDLLIQKAAYGNKNQGERKILSPIALEIGEGIIGSVAKTKKLELVKNVKNDKRYIKDDIARNSELAVPILFHDSLIGVLDSEHSKENFFRNEHIFLFELIAKLTAVKLNQIQQSNKVILNNYNVHFSELRRLIEEEKIYRNPNLSLSSVARQLNISSNYLSTLINQLNKTSFTDYINTYRVEDAKKMLINSKYSQFTILSIGLEAGFNSKSTFYTTFKKATGKTPTTFKEEQL